MVTGTLRFSRSGSDTYPHAYYSLGCFQKVSQPGSIRKLLLFQVLGEVGRGRFSISKVLLNEIASESVFL
jgi:hypothetical protein